MLAEQYPNLKRGLWWLLAVSVVRHHRGFRRMDLMGVYQVCSLWWESYQVCSLWWESTRFVRLTRAPRRHPEQDDFDGSKAIYCNISYLRISRHDMTWSDMVCPFGPPRRITCLLLWNTVPGSCALLLASTLPHPLPHPPPLGPYLFLSLLSLFMLLLFVLSLLDFCLLLSPFLPPVLMCVLLFLSPSLMLQYLPL